MDRLDPRMRTGALVGALAMFLALDVAFLVSLIGMPFAPFALGQALIAIVPGSLQVALIETLLSWAKILLVIGVVALFFVGGSVAGAFAAMPRRSDRAVGIALAAPWVVAVGLAQVFAPLRIDLATSVIDAAAGLATNALALAYLVPASLSRERSPAPDRRRVLIGGAAIATIAAIGALPVSRVFAGIGPRVGGVPTTARKLAQHAAIPSPDPGVDAIAGLTGRITPNDQHYTVDTTLVKPRVDAASWKLDVAGNVERPFSIAYEELLDMDAIEQPRTLECISNPVGGDLISTAVWTGVRMRDLIARASPKPGTYDVVLTSVDGYSDSFPIAKAMEDDTLIAYLMNGDTLPQEHGYPARALVPNIYGMKNVKWLREIRLETFDFKGYWQQQGWNDTAIVNTGARIDVPERTLRWGGGDATLAGIAFAGARGIKAVELSFDAGKTWRQAALETPVGPLTWVRWVYRWSDVAVGPRTVWARATDGGDDVQTPVLREPYPDGATGYPTISVNVVRV